MTFAAGNAHDGKLEGCGNMFFMSVPSLLLGSHVYTICIFRSLLKFFALLHHSGYEFSFKPMHRIRLCPFNLGWRELPLKVVSTWPSIDGFG